VNRGETPAYRSNEKEDTMERLTRYGFLQTSVCLSSDVEKLEARVEDLKDDLKSTIESSNEMSDRNGELTAELAGLKEGAFQAHEQHDADQAEIARLTAELREGGREMNYTQMAEGFIQIPEEKWDAVQAELAQVKADLAVMCERQNSLKMAEVLGRYLDKKEEGK